MMTHLIPEKLDKFVLQDMNTEYMLTFADGGIDISVKINKDLVITELSTPQGSVKPSLTEAKGFLLTGYEGTNEDPVVGRVVLKASIESAPVAGMQLTEVCLFRRFGFGNAIQLKVQFHKLSIEN